MSVCRNVGFFISSKNPAQNGKRCPWDSGGIDFPIFKCSDTAAAKAVAERTYKAAVELFAMLCNKFLLDPPADGAVISHKEGHARGITSNHGDPEHLWSQLGMGYTMDTFRKEVKATMEGTSEKAYIRVVPTYSNSKGMKKGIENALVLDDVDVSSFYSSRKKREIMLI